VVPSRIGCLRQLPTVEACALLHQVQGSQASRRRLRALSKAARLVRGRQGHRSGPPLAALAPCPRSGFARPWTTPHLPERRESVHENPRSGTKVDNTRGG
jgi:hypothetical protein